MLKNYLTVALRNLLRYKGYATINVLGLAIGMATSMIIFLYVQDELAFDAWHEKGDRIYRVIRETKAGGMSSYRSGTSGPLSDAIESDIPEAQTAIRVWFGFNWVLKDNTRLEAFSISTEPEFFELFDFPVLRGSLDAVFADPNAIAITESSAKRLIGPGDPIGKTLRADDKHMGGERVVVAVLKDVPKQSRFQFDYISGSVFSEEARMVWDAWRPTSGWRPIETYALFREGTDASVVERKVDDLIDRYMGPEIAKTNAYHLQRFDRIYLHSVPDYGSDVADGPSGDINRVYQFSAIAFLVLVIGCINFANLSTALSASRAKEVGLRKVAGGVRQQLMAQFLSESVLTALIALLVGLLLASLALPSFNTYFEKQLELDLVRVLAPGLVAAVLVGVAAGLYPAVFLSSFEPTETLKGTFRTGSRGQMVRKGLVVAQFAISIVLIVGTGIIYQQLDYIMTKNLGYDASKMVMVPIFEIDAETKQIEEEQLTDRYRTVKQAFLAHPNVLEATAYRWWMGYGGGITRAINVEGHEGTDWRMPVLEVDEDYIDVFRIEMSEGRRFDIDTFPTDTLGAFILNETAVQKLGWDDPSTGGAIGKTFTWLDRNITGRVIGVVKDFHYSPLRERIAPMAMTHYTYQFQVVGMRIRPEGLEETTAHFKKLWEQFGGGSTPYFQEFWEAQFEWNYAAEMRVQNLTLLSSGIAILLACMGLFGLASFAMEERKKEIGVRKSLGASVSSVIVLVSREFLIMVGIAAIIAIPIGWRAMTGWLENFAYRMDVGPGVFIVGSLVALVIAQLTVTYHAQRAARMDPVKALRYE